RTGRTSRNQDGGDTALGACQRAGCYYHEPGSRRRRRAWLAMSWDDTTQVKGPPAEASGAESKRVEAYLIVMAGSSVGEMYKLNRPRTVIGRGPTAEIRILDEGVSREHC